MPGMIELKSNLVIERPVNCEWLVRQDERTFEVDLTRIHQVESRRNELMAASGRGLIELANDFDDGYDAACKLHSRVIYEVEMATIASRKRRAVLLRDELPTVIKDRGLASSRSPVGAEDIRETIYYEDDEFVRLEQYRAALEAIRELLFGKMMSMNRLCKRTEVLLQRREAGANGLGESDPAGKRLEDTMNKIMSQHENVTNTVPARRGFATKERD
jgi:Mg2+ and Co2+ transporter CorA